MKRGLYVLVSSCHDYVDKDGVNKDAKAKRRACRETWLHELPPGVKYRFLVGGKAPAGEESDTWGVPAEDSYYRLPEKVRAGMLRALRDPDWDWMFKCDDDSYVVLPRLLALLESGRVQNYEVVSRLGRQWPHSLHGGAGYLLSREMVEEIVLDDDYEPFGIYEDQQVSFAAVRAGADLVNDDRFEAFGRVWPAKGNEQISTHWVKPEQMRAIKSGL